MIIMVLQNCLWNLDCHTIKFSNNAFSFIYNDTKQGVDSIIGNTMGNCDKRSRCRSNILDVD